MTDTVKVVREGLVGATVDREGLRVVASPIVLSPQVCAALPAPPPTLDFAALVARLRREVPTTLLTAPPEGRRVTSPDDLRLLAALTRGAPDSFPA